MNSFTSHMIMLFSLAPIFRGFIAMLISGAAFPLCGVMVMRLNLVPLRYMLMHGVILGGAISLALSLPLTPVTIIINILLVFLMMAFTKNSTYGFGGGSAATMVISMALASVIMHVANVPAKDTLSLLWGSPFALNKQDIAILGVMALILVLYVVFNFRNILCLFYNQEIASSLGINVKVHYTTMVLIIAFVIALAMKLLGAFLIDALLILPVLTSSSFIAKDKNQSVKKLFIVSSLSGLVLSALGYILAVAINFPPSGTIALLSGIAYLISFLRLRFK
jgi:zinc transport system permease protein